MATARRTFGNNDAPVIAAQSIDHCGLLDLNSNEPSLPENYTVQFRRIDNSSFSS
jgi:hypothetical protein